MQDSILKLPNWIEKYRIDDVLLATAYENAQIEIKAGIKSAIALHFALEQGQLPIRSMRTKGAFVLHDDISPCDVSIFIIDKKFNSPAQFIAGIMPALLAKSRVILIFSDEIQNNLLLTIELLGIEHVFIMPKKEDIENLCFEIYTNYSSIICIGLGFEHSFASFAWKHNIAFLFYEKNPLILGNSPLFEIAYPQAQIIKEKSLLAKNARLDIALENSIESDEIDYPLLIVGEGCEFFTDRLFNIENFLSKKRLYVFAQ